MTQTRGAGVQGEIERRAAAALPAIVVALLATFACCNSVATEAPVDSDSQYSLGPDSQQQSGVPEGRIQEFAPVESRIFPGFEHRWWLYTPVQYTDRMALPMMVFLDGESWVKRDGHWRAPVVIDNLIASKELPVMAAVFVDPGSSVAKSHGKSVFANRQEEYDSISAAYASFLLEEVFPEVRKHAHLARDAASRGIAGCSSGGIAAFTVAWQRSDQFRKVISFSGSFADLRGGQIYPQLVRHSARKPIRIFQHVGEHDVVFDGLPSWLEENTLLSTALEEKLYDHKFVVDKGTHCSVAAASILPEALRWTWRDYPR